MSSQEQSVTPSADVVTSDATAINLVAVELCPELVALAGQPSSDEHLPPTNTVIRREDGGALRIYKVAGSAPDIKRVDPETGKLRFALHFNRITADGEAGLFKRLSDNPPPTVDYNELLRSAETLSITPAIDDLLGKPGCERRTIEEVLSDTPTPGTPAKAVGKPRANRQAKAAATSAGPDQKPKGASVSDDLANISTDHPRLFTVQAAQEQWTALTHIDPTERGGTRGSKGNWLPVGLALHYYKRWGWPDNYLRAVWDKWSNLTPHKFDAKNQSYTWSDFDDREKRGDTDALHDGPLTPATIFHLAKQATPPWDGKTLVEIPEEIRALIPDGTPTGGAPAPAPSTSSPELAAEIKRLAAMPELDYARIRKDEATRLGFTAADLNKAVAKERGATGNGSGRKKKHRASFGDYEMRADGLHQKTSDGASRLTTLFEITGRARDTNSRGWVRYLKFKSKDGCEHIFAVPDDALHGDPSELCKPLTREGLWISTVPGHRNAFVNYLNCVDSESLSWAVTQTGWCFLPEGKVFVLQDQTIGDIEDDVRFAGNENSPFSANGTLKQWHDSVGDMTKDHVRGRLMVSAAFVAPLLHIVNNEGGGVHLHGLTSLGKTTLEFASASVYGNPKVVVMTWRATTTGIEVLLSRRNDLPLHLDEIKQALSKDVASVVYLVTGGKGKVRSQRNLSLRDNITWCSFIVSTGEISMADKLREDGGRAMGGQEARIIDIPCDAGAGAGVYDKKYNDRTPEQLSDAIQEASCTYYGTAGPAFIAKLIEMDNEQIIAGFRKAQSTLRGDEKNVPRGAAGQVLRVATKLALVGYAGELAIEFGIVPWDKGSAMAAAKEALRAWIDRRGGAGFSDIEAAVKQIRLLIAQHGEARFDLRLTVRHLDPKNSDPRRDSEVVTTRPSNNRLGWRDGEGDRQYWYITKEVWAAELCKGFDPALVAKALVERGMLETDRGKQTKSVWIEGRSRHVYVLTSKIAEDPLE